MPGIADRSMVKNTIRAQQRKLREEMKDIVKQKATQSAYPALSRQDKRVAEFHHDRLTQEQSLQKDTKKAERLARRIAQILDQLRKDFNKIKNFLGNYNFANTVGQDSSCDGACAEDLSTAVDTRQAWKRELENMLTMVWHYVDAQHLGDYALLHQPESTSDPTCGSSSTPVNCCPKVYRPFFHYYTPDGDCLGMATEAGGHSWATLTAVTSQTTAYGNESTVGNYNGQNGSNPITTRGCVLGYKTGTFNGAAEGAKATWPKHLDYCNAEIRQLWRLLVDEQGVLLQMPKPGATSCLPTLTRANLVLVLLPGLPPRIMLPGSSSRGHFRTTICLPEEMVLALKTQLFPMATLVNLILCSLLLRMVSITVMRYFRPRTISLPMVLGQVRLQLARIPMVQVTLSNLQ